MNTIGDNIKSWREKAKMSQDALAEAIDVNRVTLSKYESNQVVPGATILGRIAKVLHVSADILIGNDGSDMSDEAMEIWELREKVRRDPERRYMFSFAKDGDIKDLKKAIAIIDALKGVED